MRIQKWGHLRTVNNRSSSKSSSKALPDELMINGEHCTDSKTIAIKFNEYFTSTAQTLDNNYSESESEVF